MNSRVRNIAKFAILVLLCTIITYVNILLEKGYSVDGFAMFILINILVLVGIIVEILTNVLCVFVVNLKKINYKHYLGYISQVIITAMIASQILILLTLGLSKLMGYTTYPDIAPFCIRVVAGVYVVYKNFKFIKSNQDNKFKVILTTLLFLIGASLNVFI